MCMPNYAGNKASPSPDYSRSKFNLIDKPVMTATEMAKIINEQPNGSIRSLDTFFHGAKDAMSLSIAPPDTEIIRGDKHLYKKWWTENYRTSLYSNYEAEKKGVGEWNAQRNAMGNVLRYVWGDDLISGQGFTTLSGLNFNKFADNAKVEIHGCNAASEHTFLGEASRQKEIEQKTKYSPPQAAYSRHGDMLQVPKVSPVTIDNNLAAHFSRKLYDAGKANSVVIAHKYRSEPVNVNGRQDYRNNVRIIYHNGWPIGEYTQNGPISDEYINSLLKKAKNQP